MFLSLIVFCHVSVSSVLQNGHTVGSLSPPRTPRALVPCWAAVEVLSFTLSSSWRPSVWTEHWGDQPQAEPCPGGTWQLAVAKTQLLCERVNISGEARVCFPFCTKYICCVQAESTDVAVVFFKCNAFFCQNLNGTRNVEGLFLKAPEAATYQKDHWPEGRATWL